MNQRRYAPAVGVLEATLRSTGASAPLLEMLGVCLQNLDRPAEAIKMFELGMRQDPQFAPNFRHRALLAHSFEHSDPRVFHLQALQADPTDKATVVHFLWASLARCDWDGFDQLAPQGGDMATLGRGPNPISPWFFLPLMDDPAASLRMQQKRQAQRLKRMGLKTPRRAPLPDLAEDGRIRVGYFSNDFYDHATLRLFSGVLRHHDRARFELHCFNFGPTDALSGESLGQFDHVHPVQGHSDAQITALARECALDIAVDLKGDTAGGRQALFLLGQAPVQINYLGYPGTMGTAAYDYILGDPVVTPNGAEKHYAEKVIRLPTCYLPVDNRRRAGLPPTRTELGLPESAVVLACLNDPYKISRELMSIWTDALTAAPDAVLWLWHGNEDSNANLRTAFEAAGLNPARLIFADRVPHQEHITRLAQADLYLDTFNCNAHTLAAEAICAANVPLLTRAGRQFAARVGASFITAAGLPELVCDTSETYRQKLVALAKDPKELLRLRGVLARNRSQLPLFSSRQYTGFLEQAFTRAHERARARRAAKSFDVTQKDAPA